MHKDELPDPYRFSLGYIVLPYRSELMLKTDLLDGQLVPKSQFHVSLVAVKNMVPLVAAKRQISSEEAERIIVMVAAQHLRQHPVKLIKTSPDYLRVDKPDEETGEPRTTLVKRVELAGLEELHQSLREKFDLPDFPLQPAHVTIYVLKSNQKPIGITSEGEMAKYAKLLASTNN